MLYSYMMISYNISRVNLSLAISITPGKKAPTISPLEGSIYGDCESLFTLLVYMLACIHVVEIEVVVCTCNESMT